MEWGQDVPVTGTHFGAVDFGLSLTHSHFANDNIIQYSSIFVIVIIVIPGFLILWGLEGMQTPEVDGGLFSTKQTWGVYHQHWLELDIPDCTKPMETQESEEKSAFSKQGLGKQQLHVAGRE